MRLVGRIYFFKSRTSYQDPGPTMLNIGRKSLVDNCFLTQNVVTCCLPDGELKETEKPTSQMPAEEKGSRDQEKSVLRWGGLSGMVGGIISIFVPVVLAGFVPPAPAGPAGLVSRFPDARTAIAVGNGIDFVATILLTVLIIALSWALRRTSLAPALFGGILSLLGLGVFFVESSTQVAFDPISNLYHAAGTTADQSTFGLVWQATQGMFNQFDTAAVLLLSTGIVVLGVGMLTSPTFGKGYGGVSVAVGVAGLIEMFFFGITSVLAAIIILPLYIILPILLGWKVYSLSKSSV